MRTWIGGAGLLWVVFSGSGCTMCCHPYDCCGPVYQVCGDRPICTTGRLGSVLDPRGGRMGPVGKLQPETPARQLKDTPGSMSTPGPFESREETGDGTME
ncbi:MAG: hypothetical protein JXB10_14485 [Pirellulales bacterium]|nr:hypothetical protein [Pirellulales bacterium]